MHNYCPEGTNSWRRNVYLRIDIRTFNVSLKIPSTSSQRIKPMEPPPSNKEMFVG